MNATRGALDGVRTSARRLVGALAGLLLATAVCVAQGLPTPDQGKVLIDAVVPEGCSHIPVGQVYSIIKCRPGDEYHRDKLDEDVRRLYETHFFADVQVVVERTAPSRVTVRFRVREFPSGITAIVYKGAKHMSRDDLDSATGLKIAMPLNPVINQQACRQILEKYLENGRYFASVSLDKGGNYGDTEVVFNITEGPKVKVSGIDIAGADFVSAARIKSQVHSSAAFLGILGGNFNPLLTSADISTLEEYYRNFGYHDVKVNRELQWSHDLSRVEIIYHIHEGPRYKVGTVDVRGESTLPRQELMRLDQNKKGEFFNEKDSKTTETLMVADYGFRGQSATVQPVLAWPEDKPGTVNITYDIKETPPAKVGQIKLIGNYVTKDNVILRQIPLSPGQTLSYPALREGEANLTRLNIFENNPEQGVHPTVEVCPNQDGLEYKDICVHVQETATGSLMFGLGVNSDAGLVGSIVLNERNFDITRWPSNIDDLLSGRAFRGADEEFRIEAVPGTELQRYTVSFREPSLFDSPYSFGTSGYYYDQIFNEYTEERIGGRFTIGRQLNKYWSVAETMRIEEVGVHNVPYYAPPEVGNFAGEHFLLGLRTGVTRDARDSYLRPTEGSLLELSFEQLFGDYTVPIISIEGDKYWTVYQRPDGSGRHVLALRSQVAFTTSDAPIYERFYAGGFRSMRGFEFRGVSPDVNGFKVGGDFMFLNSLEYQIPIKANDQIYMVAFVDSGTVDDHVTLDNYRVTAGFGVRVVVPMLGPVPIALDFGFPIRKASTDNTQVFSFWVGFFH